MKSLLESIFDVDDNIDNLEIPKKPLITKENCVCYLQAWYDILEHLCDAQNLSLSKWAMIIKCYKTWQSDWFCHLDYEKYEEYEEEHDTNFDWYTDYIHFVDQDDKFEKDMRDEYLDSIIDDFSNGRGSDRINSQGSNSILIALFGDENLFRIEALDYKLFKSAIKWKPSYNRFYKSISKLLKIYGIKL